MNNKELQKFMDWLSDMANKEPHQKIPNKCPLINKCTQHVLETEFKSMCNSRSWVFCEFAAKRTKRYRKPPYFWKFTQKIRGDEEYDL